MSKQAIFSLLGDRVPEAEELLTEAKEILSGLEEHLDAAPDLRYTGAYKAALEEHLEARLFWQVLTSDIIKPVATPEARFDVYLPALCDLTGELVREMRRRATKGEVEQAEKLKTLIAKIVEGLTELDMLTKHLRHKFEEANNNLKNAERIMYDLKVKYQNR
ncbi:hypothetical protein MYX07_07150 [Patescibacteria group bacterium AH-259-L07]|nr:hypothetical protein [Patescibacteria group bacterium AH-259-L07]